MNTNIEQLREAQELIEQAIALIRNATADTSEEGRARAYTIGHLSTWAHDEQQIGSIPNMIAGLEEEEQGDE